MRKMWIVEGLLMTIVCLYVFVTVNKIVGYEPFMQQLKQQRLLRDYSALIATAVPIVHALLVVLLFIPKTRLIGLYASMFTLIGYSFYIGLILTNKVGPPPCNCVGIWHTMSWKTQYLINFILLAIHYFCLMNIDLLMKDKFVSPLQIQLHPIKNYV